MIEGDKMRTGKVDEIKEMFDRYDKINNISSIIFIINFILAFFLIFDYKYRDVVVLISLIFAILYVLLININEMIFSNRADNERRKSLLKESFGVNLTTKQTKKYYNNKEIESINKLGLNTYESVFFTKKIVDKMLPINILKILFLSVIYMILIIRVDNLDLLLIITQTLFSSELLFYFIKLCYFKNRLDFIYKKFEDIYFILLKSEKEEVINVLLLDLSMEYECLKSYCKISVSTSIFNKYNTVWTKEWNKLIKNGDLYKSA